METGIVPTDCYESMLKVTMIRDHFALLRPPVSSGFTLIELVVVMVVVGIVATHPQPRSFAQQIELELLAIRLSTGNLTCSGSPPAYA